MPDELLHIELTVLYEGGLIVQTFWFFFPSAGVEQYPHMNVGGGGGFSKVVATFSHVGGSFNLFLAPNG